LRESITELVLFEEINSDRCVELILLQLFRELTEKEKMQDNTLSLHEVSVFRKEVVGISV
jgi:hypothetical protein